MLTLKIGFRKLFNKLSHQPQVEDITLEWTHKLYIHLYCPQNLTVVTLYGTTIYKSYDKNINRSFAIKVLFYL